MNSIYIVLLSTNTKMGSIIRLVTRYKYNHVAIALNKDLSKMYSFARYKKKAALVGGFIHEKPSRYITQPPCIKVFKLDFKKEDYNTIIEKIKKMKSRYSNYIYNTYSAIIFPLKRNVKIKDAYTCFEFAQYILEEPLLDAFKNIKELDNKLSERLIFEGKLDDYINIEENKNDEYFEDVNLKKVAGDTANHFIKLSKRYLSKKEE